MRNLAAVFAASLIPALTGAFATSLTATVQAQPATLQDAVLTIPQAVDMTGPSPIYYANVQLTADADGSLKLLSAEQQNLTFVDTVEVLVMESFPVQISLAIAGNKSVPCVELLPAAVTRSGNAFTVVLAETVLGPAETCIAVLDPFETTVSLDVLGLAAGDYTVSVNGVEASFTLAQDNVGLPSM